MIVSEPFALRITISGLVATVVLLTAPDETVGVNVPVLVVVAAVVGVVAGVTEVAAIVGPAANAPGTTVDDAAAGVSVLALALGAVVPPTPSPAPLLITVVGPELTDEFTVACGLRASAGLFHCPVG